MGEVIRLQDHVQSKDLKKELDDLAKTLDTLANKLIGIIDDAKNLNTTFEQGKATQSDTSKNIKAVNTNLETLSQTEKEIKNIHDKINELTELSVIIQKTQLKKIKELRIKSIPFLSTLNLPKSLQKL